MLFAIKLECFSIKMNKCGLDYHLTPLECALALPAIIRLITLAHVAYTIKIIQLLMTLLEWRSNLWHHSRSIIKCSGTLALALARSIVSNLQVKQLRLFNQVYLVMPSKKSQEYLYEIATGENRVGSKRRRREIEKESHRLAEWETEHWTELEITWVGNGR